MLQLLAFLFGCYIAQLFIVFFILILSDCQIGFQTKRELYLSLIPFIPIMYPVIKKIKEFK